MLRAHGQVGRCSIGGTVIVSRDHPASRLARIVGLVLLLAACGSGGHEPPSMPAEGVVVASFNFAESRLVAEIYAQALEDEGIEVQRELDLGPRELVLPALRQGRVDIVPEYLGTALTAVAPTATVDRSDPESVSRALADTVEPWGLRVLRHAEAQNQNGLVVARPTAERQALRTTSDLAPLAPTLTLGGPPECPTRPYCLEGLTEVYGLRFAGFVPLDGQAYVRRALKDEVIDVGVLFTTDGALAGDDLLLLEDDRGLQPAENLVPLVRSDVLESAGDRRVEAVLDEVSQRLTTPTLRFLNWRVSVAGNDPASEARGWLVRHGLVER
jgi:osmoprotectant transport system substrate-binding protein